MTTTGAILWGLTLLWIVFVEGVMLGLPEGVPLTTVLRTIRMDVYGRYVICMLVMWINWHIIFRPFNMPAMSKWDLIPLAIGAAIGALAPANLWPIGGIVG
jgi:hypothetical protein